MNYLLNKYNIFRHLLKSRWTILWNTNVQNVAIALPLLDDNAINSTIFFNFLKHLKKHITVLTYLLSRSAVRVPVTSSRR